MRIAVVDPARCQPKKCQYECIVYCPVVRQGLTDCVTNKGPGGKAVISEELCVGCGICVKKCPFDAIRIINLPQALEKDIVHRYGENGFALFRLPIPKPGKVVGLLGPNGIGKSTALRILSGKEPPNLGDWTKGGRWEPAIRKYSGTELGEYLKKVSRNEVRSVTKPQYVDLLPKAVRGTVREVLEKAAGRRVFEALESFHLTHLSDHPVDSLSGGELQRLTVAAALSTEADVYFIDEPSSYLDIRERLRMAREIRRKAEVEGKAVVLVEHDLAVLDYVADEVHILYGTEGAYGVVSLPRAVRSAINVYLEGYLREENVRIRESPIRFELHAPRTGGAGTTLLEFPPLEKVLGTFHLETAAGVIRKGDVVGVVGPNGTGKTTFVKMLAGVESPTRGSLPTTLKVSYKPQYLKSEYEGDVRTLLLEVAGEDATTSYFQSEIASPLGLNRLEPKLVFELSGGELQRVAIALALLREADLYLLDEPSAYLDVEERMNAARVIRRSMENRGKSALVVDHDVYFLDMVSDSLMVFQGKPGVRGEAKGPFPLQDGMNRFLSDVGVTFRRDKETLRPRVNKEGSRLDREQRGKGEYYYSLPTD